MLFAAENFSVAVSWCAPAGSRAARLLVRSGLFLILLLPCGAGLWPQSATHPAPQIKPEGRAAYLEGMRYVQQRQIDDAIRVFEQGLTLDPNDPVLLDATGAAYIFKSDLESAKKYLLASLQADPGFVPAHKNLVIAYFNGGEYDLAEAQCRILAKTPGPTQQVADLFLGMISEKKGDYVHAAAFFSHSATLLRGYPEALLSYANAEYQLKNVEKANEILSELRNIQGLTAQQHLKLSQLATQLGHDDLALAEVEKAQAQDSLLEGLQYQNALALDRVGRSREALQILEDLASQKPDADVLNLLSHVARETGEFSVAFDSLRMAAKLAPQKEENYLDFSTFCADYNNNNLALEAAEVGLQNIPNSYRLLVQKAAILEVLGRFDDAETTLRKASEQQKDNSIALLSLAIVQTHAGRLQEAEDTLVSALRQYPNNYYMHYQLGVVLVAIQERVPPNPQIQARAKQAFRDAIRLNPGYADSYYQLAKLYSDKSPKLEEENLVACLRADPNHASAEYKLARLYKNTGREAQAQELIARFESLRQAAKTKEMQQPRIESAPK